MARGHKIGIHAIFSSNSVYQVSPPSISGCIDIDQ